MSANEIPTYKFWKNICQNEKGVVFETRLTANEMKTVKIDSLKLLTQQKNFNWRFWVLTFNPDLYLDFSLVTGQLKFLHWVRILHRSVLVEANVKPVKNLSEIWSDEKSCRIRNQPRRSGHIAIRWKCWKVICCVTLICSIDDLTWVATHHVVDLDLFIF